MKLIVIIDDKSHLELFPHSATLIDAIDFIDGNYAHYQENSIIVNLCSCYNYQSLGYYVSLIAEARGQKVLPSILTIQDINTKQFHSLIDAKLSEDIQKLLLPLRTNNFKLSIFFGLNVSHKYASLCRKLYGLLPMPLFQISFEKHRKWQITGISALNLPEISENLRYFFTEAFGKYIKKKRFHAPKRKKFYYDLAMLYNPKEAMPPSNPSALKYFIDAGENLGIRVELIEHDDYKTLKEFDALFIRETTSVNNYTYKFSRGAMAENIVVVDDPSSILQCSNKVYLSELLTSKKIKTPYSIILAKDNWQDKLAQISYPCVLKKPDGAFSKGIVKANDERELIKYSKDLFQKSHLIIAQELIQSEFDWRIGIFDKRILFACKYYMAEGHWQIYNWKSKGEKSGQDEAISINDVPEVVRKTALRAANLIGDGLYGVDIKQQNNVAYVIEINDNPNIEHGIEDKFSGLALYEDIMKIFLHKIRKKYGYEHSI